MNYSSLPSTCSQWTVFFFLFILSWTIHFLAVSIYVKTEKEDGFWLLQWRRRPGWGVDPDHQRYAYPPIRRSKKIFVDLNVFLIYYDSYSCNFLENKCRRFKKHMNCKYMKLTYLWLRWHKFGCAWDEEGKREAVG